MIIPMSVNVAYLPEWGITEGLRELLQNWLDAGSEVTPTLDDKGVLTIENPGKTLDRSALLIGTTSKAGKVDQRGQFGEGLKLGALALVRAGRSVTVYTGAEVWTATIRAHGSFAGLRVLCWDCRPSAKPGVCIKVGGVTAEEWDAVRALFLHFGPATRAVEAYNVTLLPDQPGRMYVKGILVEPASGFMYGYDFLDAKVDRDRKMINAFDKGYAASRALIEGMRRGVLSALTLVDMGMLGAADAGYLSYHVGEDDRAKLTEEWLVRYGAHAVVCADEDERKGCVSLGEHGVVVASDLRRLLTCRTWAEVRQAARIAVVEVHPEDSLTDGERDRLGWACLHARLAFRLSDAQWAPHRSLVSIVTFRDPKTLGMFVGGRIQLSRAILSDAVSALGTLIHELSHHVGGDGDREHTSVIEVAWETLARRWTAPPTSVEAWPKSEPAPEADHV